MALFNFTNASCATSNIQFAVAARFALLAGYRLVPSQFPTDYLSDHGVSLGEEGHPVLEHLFLLITEICPLRPNISWLDAGRGQRTAGVLASEDVVGTTFIGGGLGRTVGRISGHVVDNSFDRDECGVPCVLPYRSMNTSQRCGTGTLLLRIPARDP